MPGQGQTVAAKNADGSARPQQPLRSVYVCFCQSVSLLRDRLGGSASPEGSAARSRCQVTLPPGRRVRGEELLQHSITLNLGHRYKVTRSC